MPSRRVIGRGPAPNFWSSPGAPEPLHGIMAQPIKLQNPASEETRDSVFDPLSLPRSRSLPPLCVCLSLLSLCRNHHFPSLFSLYPTQNFNFLHPSVLKPPPPQLLSDSLALVPPAVIDVARLDLPFSLSLPPPSPTSLFSCRPARLSDSHTRIPDSPFSPCEGRRPGGGRTVQCGRRPNRQTERL